MNITGLENVNPEGINYREIKGLISHAFEKARSESKRSSKPGWYAYISDNLKNTSPSERTIERYYKKYIGGKLDEIGQPKEDIIDELSIWLGYKSFADFCFQNFSDEKNIQKKIPILTEEHKNESEEVENQLSFLQNTSGKKNYLKGGVTGLGIATIIGFSSYLGLNGEKPAECMYWKDSHYERVACEKEVHPNAEKELYDERLYKYFYRIEITDTTTFFRAGVPIVWYVKIDGEPEFYSADGRHPINGKELKPVTPYIIEKYVFDKLRNKKR